MKVVHETLSLPDIYAGMHCLLNGLPAKIARQCDRFATVYNIEFGHCFHWTWEEVDKVMRSTRNFKS